MIDRFEIVSSDSPRPQAERIIFCDGTGGCHFREETDLELSHWRPNLTPTEYRAGTSTEICFRFLDNLRPGLWTVAVNNHVDVDGILSVYVLVHSEHAQRHREIIIAAAEMGDFWAWGELASQRVFQGITHLMWRGGKAREVYAEAFQRIPALIDGSDPQLPEIDASLAPLSRGCQLVEQGAIARNVIDQRLAHYIVPRAIVPHEDSSVAYAPEFNEAISSNAILWPHVRARWDTERVCIVSVERPGGWFHDLCFPGYLWADTEGLWRVPGLTYHDGMGSYKIEHEGLIAAFDELQRQETSLGQWGLGGTRLPFGDELQDLFPLVGRLMNESGPAVSHLAPDRVADAFRGLFV